MHVETWFLPQPLPLSWPLFSGQEECFPCPAGLYCQNGTRYHCPPGFYCPPKTGASLFPCPPGTYNPFPRIQQVNSCQLCPAGMEQSQQPDISAEIYPCLTHSVTLPWLKEQKDCLTGCHNCDLVLCGSDRITCYFVCVTVCQMEGSLLIYQIACFSLQACSVVTGDCHLPVAPVCQVSSANQVSIGLLSIYGLDQTIFSQCTCNLWLEGGKREREKSCLFHSPSVSSPLLIQSDIYM